MTHPVAALAESSAYCRNCSLFLGAAPGNYCSNCGQDTATHPPSAWEFLHEFIGHYVAFEGKLARSLALLLCRPGALTLRYLSGKKNSYVLPLRLYLTASIVFFLVVKIFGAGNLSTSEANVEPTQANELSGQARTPSPIIGTRLADEGLQQKPLLSRIDCTFATEQCAKVKGYLKDRYQNMTVDQVGRQVRDRTMSLVPYAMFFCLPLFALLTLILYRRRKLYYGEHLVYAMHVHAFAYLLLLAIALSPKAISEWLYIVGAVYFWMAMRRVFGGRWLPTFLRYSIVGVLYPMMMISMIGLTMLAAVFV